MPQSRDSIGLPVSDPLSATRRIGLVTAAVTGTSGLVQVDIGACGESVGIPYLRSYAPHNNDVVLVLSVGGDHVVLGALSSQVWGTSPIMDKGDCSISFNNESGKQVSVSFHYTLPATPGVIVCSEFDNTNFDLICTSKLADTSGFSIRAVRPPGSVPLAVTGTAHVSWVALE